MKSKSLLFMLLLSGIALSSCNLNMMDCAKGSADEETRDLDVKISSEIDLSVAGEVVIKQGDDFSVTATGPTNVLDALSWSVSDDEWDIEFKDNQCFEDYELKIEITTPNLRQAEVSGSGNILIEDFSEQSGTLSLDVSGSGNVTHGKFEGITNLSSEIAGSGSINSNADISTLQSSEIDISGSGSYSGFALKTEECNVEISGSGQVEVSVVDDLYVDITGSGNVQYKGDCSITEYTTGSGGSRRVD